MEAHQSRHHLCCGFCAWRGGRVLGHRRRAAQRRRAQLALQPGAKEGAVYSLAIIFFSQLSKLVLSVTNGALWAIDLTFVPFVVLPAIAGGFIGTFGYRRLTEQGVRRIYVFVMALLPLISLYNCVSNVMAL